MLETIPFVGFDREMIIPQYSLPERIGQNKPDNLLFSTKMVQIDPTARKHVSAPLGPTALRFASLLSWAHHPQLDEALAHLCRALQGHREDLLVADGCGRVEAVGGEAMG